MAIHVGEIMNRELFAVAPFETIGAIRTSLVRLGVSGAPVLDEANQPLGVVSLKDLVDVKDTDLISDHVSFPAIVAHPKTPIRDAAALMAETACHRLVIVDQGIAVGIVGTLDVIRAMLGMPIERPATFPHYDPKTRARWSDDYVLDGCHVEAAPTGPGVLLILDGGADRAETTLWGESSENLRERLLEFLAEPAGGPTAVSYWKAHGNLRFRFAAESDSETRSRILEKALPDS